jgi:hypothetical protein
MPEHPFQQDFQGFMAASHAPEGWKKKVSPIVTYKGISISIKPILLKRMHHQQKKALVPILSRNKTRASLNLIENER